MQDWYKPDLAYIHDAGHRDYALKSAPGILEIFDRYNIPQELVIDLGCGSGLSAAAFVQAGYLVLGIDISAAMIDIARQRVPTAEFRVASMFKTELPPCAAVTSISECLNYLFDPDSDRQMLRSLFEHIHQALIPGGIFVFDIADTRLLSASSSAKAFTEGKDWLVLVERQTDQEQAILTRKIITFRKVGEHYRRDDEVHRQQLYRVADIAADLQTVGFQVQTADYYGSYQLPPAHTAFIAYKTP